MTAITNFAAKSPILCVKQIDELKTKKQDKSKSKTRMLKKIVASTYYPYL